MESRKKLAFFISGFAFLFCFVLVVLFTDKMEFENAETCPLCCFDDPAKSECDGEGQGPGSSEACDSASSRKPKCIF